MIRRISYFNYELLDKQSKKQTKQPKQNQIKKNKNYRRKLATEREIMAKVRSNSDKAIEEVGGREVETMIWGYVCNCDIRILLIR